MKLRNKKTGEIGELVSNNRTLIYVDNAPKYEYNSLLDIYAEWEDYEEPKEYWYITGAGDVINGCVDGEWAKYRERIGNYFETEEEAEKAVEKLKAWKRLKDKGVMFRQWFEPDGCEPFILIETNIDCHNVYDMEELEADLDLLFGGEE